MRLRNGVTITRVEDEYMAVYTSKYGKRISRSIWLNNTAAFIAAELKEESTMAELTAALCEVYDVPENIAYRTVETVVNMLRYEGMLEK